MSSAVQAVLLSGGRTWKQHTDRAHTAAQHCANTNLDVADGVSLFIDMFAVGDDLFDLSALKKVQLQLLRHLLTEVYSIQNTQQLPAH